MTYALGQLVQDIKEYCNQSRTCTLPPNVETSTGTEVVEEREVKVEGYTINKHGIFDGDGEVLSQTPIVPCTVLDVEGAYSVRLIFPKLFGSGVAEVVVHLTRRITPTK